MWLAILRVASAVAMLLITAAGYVVYDRQTTWTLNAKALEIARTWRDVIVSQSPHLEAMLTNNEASVDTILWQDDVRLAGSLRRVDIIRSDGQFLYSTHSTTDSEDLGLDVEETSIVLSEGASFALPSVTIEERPDADGSLVTNANVLLPLFVEGRPVGAMQLAIDVTTEKSAIRRSFGWFALIISALFLLATAIPTLHWFSAWRKAQHTNEELRFATEALEASAEADLQVTAEQTRLAREVQMLGELNEWLQSSQSQRELFDIVARALSLLLPESTGEIYVYSNSRDVLDGAVGWNGGSPKDHINPDDCWALRRGRAYEYGNSELALRCEHSPDTSEDLRALCLPMLAHGETIGLFSITQRDGVDALAFVKSFKLARLCAEQVSMALANVRMRDTLQEQSIKDPLTGLFNRRHLTHTLRRELTKAERAGKEVALLSLDVDHFKRFNDNFGHDAGDMVLRAVGEVLDRVSNGDNVAFRPGGEEFMVVLADSDTAEALMLAESIREEIQDIRVRYGEKTLPTITVSVGIAVSGRDGTMPQDIMRAADEALYGAKAAGRNQSMLTHLLEFKDEPIDGEDNDRDTKCVVG